MTGYTRELRSSCEKGTSLPFDRQTGELGTPRLFYLHTNMAFNENINIIPVVYLKYGVGGITGGITGTYVIVDGKRVPGITGPDVHITDDWEALVKYTQISS